jgi:hypothetical protein
LRAGRQPNGKSLGRPFKLPEHRRREAIKRRNREDETLAVIGRSDEVSPQTISSPAI